jgi:hypothetical protein
VLSTSIDTKTTLNEVEYLDNSSTKLFINVKPMMTIQDFLKCHLKAILKSNVINELIYILRLEILELTKGRRRRKLTHIFNSNNNEHYEKYLNNILSPSDK